jgi:3-hydroxyacyl-[acyl-carrier-protein] dehydratase
MDKKYINKIQPNRSPYLFLDKISSLIPNKKCNAHLNLKKNLWFFKIHWPGNPNMPAFLQLEAMTQTCAIALFSIKGNKSKFIYVISVENAKFFKKVTPGSKLMIETKIKKNNFGMAKCSGICKVDKKIVSSADFTLLIPEKFMKKS